MDIKLEDFELKKVYQIYSKKIVPTGSMMGVLVSKNTIDCTDGKTEIVVMYDGNLEKSTVDISITDIEKYVEIDEDEKQFGFRIYDEFFDDYGIKKGSITSDIILEFVDRWDDFDDEEKLEIADHLTCGINTDIIKEFIDIWVKNRNTLNETYQRNADILKKYAEMMELYDEEKKARKGVLIGYGTL